MGRITLLTDFGTRDGFVGVMKGVLSTQAPLALLEDIAHDIPPGDVGKAARVLARVWKAFPTGTIHLVVVDPGVGTSRRGLALASQGHYFVAPDNGVLSPILSLGNEWTCAELLAVPPLPLPEGHTFHGRDLFAPAAGLLATGTPLEDLGPLVDDPVHLPFSMTPGPAGTGTGVVLETDRFGNLATDLNPGDVIRAGGLTVGGLRIPFGKTYGEVSSGELVAVVNSDGLIEVAVRDGSAQERLGLAVGGEVRISGEV